jgi:hypothetical protein
MVCCCVFIGGCGDQMEGFRMESRLKKEIDTHKTTIESLNTKMTLLTNEKEGLKVRVAELSVPLDSGKVIEEISKALRTKESNLKLLENDLIKRESKVNVLEERLDEKKSIIDVKMEKFLNKHKDEFKQIGESKESLRRRDQLIQDRKDAINRADISENRANNWLIWISIVLLFLFVSLIYIVFLFMKYRHKEQQIQTVYSIVANSKMSEEQQKLIGSILTPELTQGE